MKKPTAKEQAHVEALVRQWQANLRLQEWEIIAKARTRQQMDKMDKPADQFHGYAVMRVQHKRAAVYVLIGRSEEEMVFTVVHELLHVRLAEFCDALEVGSVGHTIEEQVVNSLATALTGFVYGRHDTL